MKMKYERPVMKAELYQVNSFVAACGDPDFIGNRTSITLGSGEGADTGAWYDVPAGTSNNFFSAGSFDGDPSDYYGLKFTKKTEQWSESADTMQYYWTSTSDKGTYYLEYSAGWTNKAQGTDVFILYKEDGGYYSENADKLDINWNWMGSNLDLLRRFDTLIGGIIFDDKIVAKS